MAIAAAVGIPGPLVRTLVSRGKTPNPQKPEVQVANANRRQLQHHPRAPPTPTKTKRCLTQVGRFRSERSEMM